MVVVQCALDGTRDVGAATARSHTTVELADEVVPEGYVQSHGHNLSHKLLHRVAGEGVEKPQLREAAEAVVVGGENEPVLDRKRRDLDVGDVVAA